MDSRNHSNALITRICCLLILAISGIFSSLRATDPYAAWDHTLTGVASRPFPSVTPFEAEYRFGWEGLSAGSAKVHVTKKNPERLGISAEGGPDAWIRKLWNYEAHYEGEAGIDGTVPAWFHLDEKTNRGDLFSDADFKQGSLVACRRLCTESKPWSVTELPEVRDLFASMLFVRSQPLRTGDHLRLTVFPDESPYLVDLTVTGRESIKSMGRLIPAIRFSIQIQTIETRGEHQGRLAPHRKFHSGRIWMSDDQLRLPLRAEVDLFIGSVFAEMILYRGE